MSASNYFENIVLDDYLIDGLYVALCTTAPTDASTGSTIVEATYTGYARITVDSADWAAASGGSKTTVNALTYALCTGGSSTVTHFAICSAISAGNVLFWGALTASLAVTNGITPQFDAGDLTITAD